MKAGPSNVLRQAWRTTAVIAAATLFGLHVAAADTGPIRTRNLETTREAASQKPRSEADQAIMNNWPLYRTPRGQAAFNEAMATLRATDGPSPHARNFRSCPDLACPLRLPSIDAAGWLPPGRLWLSASDYVLFVRSPRQADGTSYRRRSVMTMRYFVFHEFHNSSRNVDLFDTISSHFSYVFVPFYLSKPATDAFGRRFVTVVQVAPYDVVSVHATNLGSAGSGVEVARNPRDPVEPLQNLAGSLLAAMVKSASPRIEVVNHHGEEGRPMLEAYDRHSANQRRHGAKPPLTLPFVPASAAMVAVAAAPIHALLARPGMTPRPPAPTQPALPTLPRQDTLQAAPAHAATPSMRIFSLLEPPRPVPRPAQSR